MMIDAMELDNNYNCIDRKNEIPVLKKSLRN